jgi:hypothetical protein
LALSCGDSVSSKWGVGERETGNGWGQVGRRCGLFRLTIVAGGVPRGIVVPTTIF